MNLHHHIMDLRSNKWQRDNLLQKLIKRGIWHFFKFFLKIISSQLRLKNENSLKKIPVRVRENSSKKI